MFYENVEVSMIRHIEGKTDRGYSTFVFMLSVLFQAQEVMALTLYCGYYKCFDKSAGSV